MGMYANRKVEIRKMGTDPITNRDIYKTLWKCRDFELSTLWQRSAMLGVFMVALYTGYGALLLNAFEHGCAHRWTTFNLMAVGMCCFGMVFSALWIMMLKGSKGWYELCEAALNGFKEDKPGDVFENEEVRADAAFGVFYSSSTNRKMEDFELDKNLLSTAGGGFSVSRVAIAIGQVSLVGWLALAFTHVVALIVGVPTVKGFLWEYGPVLALLLLIGCVAYVFVFLTDHVASRNS